MKVLKARNEGEDQNFRIKQLNSFKERRLNQKSLTLVSKPSPERVMKSCLKCLKLEAPEMAKKPLLSLPINAQLVSNLQRITKALLWKEAGMIIFFG